MAICLGINDDIQQTFSRYDQFKKATKPKIFVSCFLGEYASSNMMNQIENPKENVTVNNQFIKGDQNNVKKEVDLLGLGNSSNQNNQGNNQGGQKKDYIKDLNDIFG